MLCFHPQPMLAINVYYVYNHCRVNQHFDHKTTDTIEDLRIYFFKFSHSSAIHLKTYHTLPKKNLCVFYLVFYFFLFVCVSWSWIVFLWYVWVEKNKLLYIRNQHFSSAKYTLAANSRLVGHWRWLFWRFICYFRLCMLRVIFFWFSFPLSFNEIYFSVFLASAQNKYLNNYNWQRNCVTL